MDHLSNTGFAEWDLFCILKHILKVREYLAYSYFRIIYCSFHNFRGIFNNLYYCFTFLILVLFNLIFLNDESFCIETRWWSNNDLLIF